jgi:two-component system, sensor histidine kinase and response regulator
MELNSGLEGGRDSVIREQLDRDALWQMVEQDMRLLSELVDIFLAEYPGTLRSIEEALEQGDVAGLRRASHKLKGALVQLAASKAAAIAEALERSTTVAPAKNLGLMVDKLRTEVNCLAPLLKSMISELKQAPGNTRNRFLLGHET